MLGAAPLLKDRHAVLPELEEPEPLYEHGVFRDTEAGLTDAKHRR